MTINWLFRSALVLLAICLLTPGVSATRLNTPAACFSSEQDAIALGSSLLADFWHDVTVACSNGAPALAGVLDTYFADDVSLTPPFAQVPVLTSLEELKDSAVPDLQARCPEQTVSWIAFEAAIVDGNSFIWSGNEVRVQGNVPSITSRQYKFQVDNACRVQFQSIRIFATDTFDTCLS